MAENLFSVKQHKKLKLGPGNSVCFEETNYIQTLEVEVVKMKEKQNGHYIFQGVPAAANELVGHASPSIAIVGSCVYKYVYSLQLSKVQ